MQELERLLADERKQCSLLRAQLAEGARKLQNEKEVFEKALEQLDEQHQDALAKILSLKDELVESNRKLADEVQGLLSRLEEASSAKEAAEKLVSALQVQSRSLQTSEAGDNPHSDLPGFDGGNTLQGSDDREEPEGAPRDETAVSSQAPSISADEDCVKEDALQALQSLLRDKDHEISSLREHLDTEIAQRDATIQASIAQNEQLKAQIEELISAKERLGSQLDRLRSHLVGIEEGYTQEVLLAEEREKGLRHELRVAEEQLARLSSNAQVEHLKEQLQAALLERNRALEEASTLDDKVHQYASQTTNLQLVIEQTQKGTVGRAR